MSILGREASVDIYGPAGIAEFLEAVLDVGLGSVSFPVNVHIINPSSVIERGRLKIGCVRADHGAESYCYVIQEAERPGKMNVEYLERLGLPRGPLWGRLQRGQPVKFRDMTISPNDAVGPPRPGRKIVYTGDTRPSQAIVEAAKEADVLIHDSTFDESLRERAREEGHSTARQAAEVAANARVRTLFLFHISARYEDNPELLLGEARSVFPNTYIAEDLSSYLIPYRDSL